MRLVVAHLPAGTRGRTVRTALFFLAILLVNYTLGRPSPVDIAFAAALAMTVFCHQSLTPSSLTYLLLAIVWSFGLYWASSPFMEDPEVQYQVVKIGYAISISFTACLTAVHWGHRQLELFFKVWILSSCIAAGLGTFGFATGNELFTWDGRAKGLLDDPNMYGAFLLPGLMGAIHFMFTAQRRWIYAFAVAWLTLGMLLSFSRIAIAAYFILGTALAVFLNRDRPMKVLAYLAVMVVVVTVIGAIALLALDSFGDKLTDRLTLVKSYDGGEYGRLGRYFIAMDLILTQPMGLGATQFEKTYPEPIHNILLSSFMNYGWGAGFAWCAVLVFAVVLSIRNFVRTRDPLFITLLIAWGGILSCAMLHEAERWRHMWLVTGLVWGLNVRNWPSATAYENEHAAHRAPRPPVLQPAYS